MGRKSVALTCIFALSIVSGGAYAKKKPKAPPPPPPPTTKICPDGAVIAIALECSPPPPPPPPPGPPRPPGSESPNYILPGRGVDGYWATPNRGIDINRKIWHFRTALNVASLACRSPKWDVIAANYTQMLSINKAKLGAVNKIIDSEYVAKYGGTKGLRRRDTDTMNLYNWFSRPSVKWTFCDLALAKSNNALLISSEGFPDFAVSSLGQIDDIFQQFFNDFQKYKNDKVAWDLEHPPAVIVAPPAPPKKTVKRKTIVKKGTAKTSTVKRTATKRKK
jgi:hypothetical protein